MTILELLKKMRANPVEKEVIKAHLIWKLNQLSYLDLSVFKNDLSHDGKYREDDKITARDLHHLSECLIDAPRLKHLDLRGNQFGNQGAYVLGKILASNTTLESIFIEDNNITEEGAMALEKGLEKNSTLLSLDPKQNAWLTNPFNPKDRYEKALKREAHIMKEFIKLASNKSLKHTWSHGNSISVSMKNIIDKILTRKRWAYAKKELARESVICNLSQEFMLEEIKNHTQKGIVMGLTVGGIGALLGVVSWPAIVPFMLTLGLVQRAQASCKEQVAYERAQKRVNTLLNNEVGSRASIFFEMPAHNTPTSSMPVILSYPNEDNMIEISYKK